MECNSRPRVVLVERKTVPVPAYVPRDSIHSSVRYPATLSENMWKRSDRWTILCRIICVNSSKGAGDASRGGLPVAYTVRVLGDHFERWILNGYILCRHRSVPF